MRDAELVRLPLSGADLPVAGCGNAGLRAAQRRNGLLREQADRSGGRPDANERVRTR